MSTLGQKEIAMLLQKEGMSVRTKIKKGETAVQHE